MRDLPTWVLSVLVIVVVCNLIARCLEHWDARAQDARRDQPQDPSAVSDDDRCGDDPDETGKQAAQMGQAAPSETHAGLHPDWLKLQRPQRV